GFSPLDINVKNNMLTELPDALDFTDQCTIKLARIDFFPFQECPCFNLLLKIGLTEEKIIDTMLFVRSPWPGSGRYRKSQVFVVLAEQMLYYGGLSGTGGSRKH